MNVLTNELRTALCWALIEEHNDADWTVRNIEQVLRAPGDADLDRVDRHPEQDEDELFALERVARMCDEYGLDPRNFQDPRPDEMGTG